MLTSVCYKNLHPLQLQLYMTL